MKLTDRDKERFWAKVQVLGEDDCWEWRASFNNSGYGQFRLGGRAVGMVRLAHRISLALFQDVDVESLGEVRHGCDNSKCVNPHHLKEGTHQDNMRDAVERKRMASGQQNGASKLTPLQVAYIKFGPFAVSRTECKYVDVVRETARKVKENETWKDVTEEVFLQSFLDEARRLGLDD